MYYTNGIIVRRCLTNVFSTELARVGGASFHKEVIHILRNHQGRGGFGMITIMQVLLYPITNLITKGGRVALTRALFFARARAWSFLSQKRAL